MDGGWDDGEPGRITSARDMHHGFVIAELAMHLDGFFCLPPCGAAFSSRERSRPRSAAAAPPNGQTLLAEL
jgi:hypothetical protein